MKQKLIILIFSFLGILIFFAFSNAKYTDDYKKEIPPGTIKIAENLFVDQTEITNLDWREYLHWTARIFGGNSEEYKSALPDTNVWQTTKTDCIESIYSSFYLRHPAYLYYPIVGITQEQAVTYLKWRSDRVFESILILNKIIPENIKQDRNNYFTIEKYFKGAYENIKPNKDFQFYPKYVLPNEKEFNYMLKYNDSILKVTRKLKISKKTDLYYDTLQLDIQVCKNDSLYKEPLRPVNIDWVADKNKYIYNLIGNVAEWLSNENQYAGKSWYDKRNNSLINVNEKQTSYIGVRGICKWIKNDYVP